MDKERITQEMERQSKINYTLILQGTNREAEENRKRTNLYLWNAIEHELYEDGLCVFEGEGKELEEAYNYAWEERNRIREMLRNGE